MSHIVDKNELNALISLVDEPNDDTYEIIQRKIINCGKAAIPILEDNWVNILDEIESDRIEKLIDDIRQNQLYDEFNTWIFSSNHNLIEVLKIIARYLQPDFNEEHYANIYKRIERDVWVEINDNLTALEKVKVINHVLFKVHKFLSTTDSVQKPETYYFNKILDYNNFNMFTIGIFYISIAQRLNIPIYGVNLPSQNILAYLDKKENTILPFEVSETEVLFYINPNNNGSPFTRNEIVHYLNVMKIAPKDNYFEACNNITVLKNMLGALIISLEADGDSTKTLALRNMLLQISSSVNYTKTDR